MLRRASTGHAPPGVRRRPWASARDRPTREVSDVPRPQCRHPGRLADGVAHRLGRLHAARAQRGARTCPARRAAARSQFRGAPRQRATTHASRLERGPRAMIRCFLRVALFSGLVLLGACDPASLLRGCSDDLVMRVDPRSRTLSVGESYTAAASAWGCGGTRRLSDEWRYFAVDTTVARVDSVTGRVTARGVGTTDVGARGTRYGDSPSRSRVTVTQ